MLAAIPKANAKDAMMRNDLECSILVICLELNLPKPSLFVNGEVWGDLGNV